MVIDFIKFFLFSVHALLREPASAVTGKLGWDVAELAADVNGTERASRKALFESRHGIGTHFHDLSFVAFVHIVTVS